MGALALTAVFSSPTLAMDSDGDGLTDEEEQRSGGVAFLTRTTVTGDIGGINGGNAVCRSDAAAAGLNNPNSFDVWLSTSNNDAVDRIDDRIYVRPDGPLVALSLADLTDGHIDNPIRRHADGGDRAPDLLATWTGTRIDGTALPLHCDNWTSSAQTDEGAWGRPFATGTAWTENPDLNCDTPRPLYCFGFDSRYKANPNRADTDGDGLLDGDEILITFTQPNNADSDGDGTNDFDEDLDGDGFSNGVEVYVHRSDPRAVDSDKDSLPDADEINIYHTDPASDDSDSDGADDSEELNVLLTDPLDPDYDQDGLSDGFEINVNNTDTTVFVTPGVYDGDLGRAIARKNS